MFPKTLAAPAIAPNVPVISGFMGLLGLSPGCEWGLQSESDGKVKGTALKAEEHGPGTMKLVTLVWETVPWREALKCLDVGSWGRRRTSIPVTQGGHDEEADGLVGSLL